MPSARVWEPGVLSGANVDPVSDVMIPSVFPTRQQAEIQTRWAFQIAAQEPLVLYSLLAISAAERSARLGELKSGSQETTYTEEDLINRPVPDFVSHKLNAMKLANETMKTMETAIKASTIFAMMCLLSIEVCRNILSALPVLKPRPGDHRKSKGDFRPYQRHSEAGCLARWISRDTSTRHGAYTVVRLLILAAVVPTF